MTGRCASLVGAGAILSVGLLRSIEWAKMEKRFDVDGGVSGGIAFTVICTSQFFHTFVGHAC